MDKIIKITVDQLGSATIEADGFEDGSCLKATAPFEQALTNKPVSVREFKPESSCMSAAQQEEHLSW